MGKKFDQSGTVTVKVYFNKAEFTSICEQATKNKNRRVGLQPFVVKQSGFAGEQTPNTDGVASYLKFCAQYHKDWEIYRVDEAAKLDKAIIDLQAQKARLRMG